MKQKNIKILLNLVFKIYLVASFNNEITRDYLVINSLTTTFPNIESPPYYIYYLLLQMN